jgi:hypothetical protein
VTQSTRTAVWSNVMRLFATIVPRGFSWPYKCCRLRPAPSKLQLLTYGEPSVVHAWPNDSVGNVCSLSTLNSVVTLPPWSGFTKML